MPRRSGIFSSGAQSREVPPSSRAVVQAHRAALEEQRDGRWVIVDLRGEHGRLRTITVPAWVKQAVDLWWAAGIIEGRIL